jgi:hypothetical protein
VALLSFLLAAPGALASASETSEPEIVTIITPGGDDSSYRIPLTTPVMFDGVMYDSVYATTNSVITFGSPDGTYWDYPMTPSISLYSMDWVVFPSRRADEHLIISASAGGFQVNISARPIWMQSAPEPTNINIVAAINADGTVAISYFLSGPDYADYPHIRTGVRLTDGSVVTLEEYGIVRVEEPPVLQPEPTQPTPEPVEPTPEAVEPTPEPVDPAPELVEPSPEPVVEPQPEPQPEPVLEPTPEAEPALNSPVSPVQPTLPPEVITLTPDPVMPSTSPTEVEISFEPVIEPEINAIEAIAAFVNAVMSAGLDMTSEERKKAQSVVIPSVMVALVATSAIRKIK